MYTYFFADLYLVFYIRGEKAKMLYFSVLSDYVITVYQIFLAISSLLSTCVTYYEVFRLQVKDDLRKLDFSYYTVTLVDIRPNKQNQFTKLESDSSCNLGQSYILLYF